MKDEDMDNKGPAKIVIVFPTLNEASAMGEVLDRVKQAMVGYNCQVLVVDGHSVDGTDKIAADKGATVVYQKGKGYGNALKTGFVYARKQLGAKILVMLDADMTYDPKFIPKLVDPIISDKADMVVGNRFAGMKQGAMPFVNRIGNRMLSFVAKLALGLNIFDTQSGMRAFRSDFLDSMKLEAVGMPFAMEMLAEAHSAKARMCEVPVTYSARVGETKLNPIKDGGRILGVTVRLMFDIRPLLFFGSIGTVLGAVGLLLHYLLMPSEFVYIMFPFLFMFGGLSLSLIGFVMYLIQQIRTRN
ncbi:MAG: glycosyltransferase family 2 protein [Candidatus Bathyarchaeota archaeon]|nr:glycosyltransferase family 2 protein [Candidatus Bathyarchaeota archaeon]